MDFDKTDPNMYFLVEGNAMVFNNHFAYQKFLTATDKANDEKQIKKSFTDQKNFSQLARIGWVVLAFIQKNEALQHIIERGKARLKAKELEDRLVMNVNFTKLKPGDSFGDFFELNAKTYKQ